MTTVRRNEVSRDPFDFSSGGLVQLRIPRPVPLVFNAPALVDQFSQGFWFGPQAREEAVGPWRLVASVGHGGTDYLDDPADAWPVRSDVIRALLLCGSIRLGPHLPDGVLAMFFALSRCGERDLALTLKLALDLAQQGFLVPFDRQEHVGPLGEAPAKNA